LRSSTVSISLLRRDDKFDVDVGDSPDEGGVVSLLFVVSRSTVEVCDARRGARIETPNNAPVLLLLSPLDRLGDESGMSPVKLLSEESRDRCGPAANARTRPRPRPRDNMRQKGWRELGECELNGGGGRHDRNHEKQQDKMNLDRLTRSQTHTNKAKQSFKKTDLRSQGAFFEFDDIATDRRRSHPALT
jgi:hypothetical protein